MRRAPAGSPFRPLYDSRIMFITASPIRGSLSPKRRRSRVLQRSLVPGGIREGLLHIHGLYRRREAATTPVKPPTNPSEALFTPPKTRGRPDSRSLAAAAVRHAAEYYVPIEPHNPMSLMPRL